MDRILIVEDDRDIALSLKYYLEKVAGFSAEAVHDGEDGLRTAELRPPDLILLDLNLPVLDGTEVCRKLRQSALTRTIPIIMITARVEESDKIAGLDLGADDYITKPFSMKEVAARVRATLRRARTALETPRILRRGPIELDEAERRASVEGRDLRLTRREFDLLADLMSRPGRVASRETLLQRVWGYEHPGETRTVDVHIRQLRKKLGSEAAKLIETVVGVGYRMRTEG